MKASNTWLCAACTVLVVISRFAQAAPTPGPPGGCAPTTPPGLSSDTCSTSNQACLVSSGGVGGTQCVPCENLPITVGDNKYCTLASPSCDAGQTCQVTTQGSVCGKCVTGGGDPHFAGFDNTRFEFPGVPGANFSLISSTTTQLNTQIESLGHTDGSTFMIAIGVLVAPDIRIGVYTPADCTKGNITLPFTVMVGEETLSSGDSTTIKSLLGDVVVENLPVDASGYRLARITTPNLHLNVMRGVDSCFLDMAVNYIDADNAEEVDGVLGQTLRCAKNPSTPCPINGDESAWMVSDLFSYDAPTNKFDPNGAVPTKITMRKRALIEGSTGMTTASFRILGGSQRGLELVVNS